MQTIADKLIEINFDKDHPELFEEITKNDQESLIDISKKLNAIHKTLGEDRMFQQLMLHRAKIMDHFALAYMADTGFKPSEIKLVQGINEDGYVEMFFEKNSKILSLEDIQL